MARRLIAPWVLAAALGMSSCLFHEGSQVSGPGTGDETPNSIAGILETKSGPAAFQLVQLIPADSDQTSGDTAAYQVSTDANGAYFFAKLAAGTYNVFAWNTEKNLQALIQGVVYQERDGAIRLPRKVMNPPGALLISLADSSFAAGGHLYLPGTRVFHVLAAEDMRTGWVTLSPVPEGIYPRVLYVGPGGANSRNLAVTQVAVSPGDTSRLDAYAGWAHSAKVILNPSAAGAGVAEDVANFPLLVRLDGTNFDFSQAQADGRDIRFAGADGLRGLPFEIERWDAANHQAEIWVRMDTISGGSESQFLRVYWGKPQAADASSGKEVFDTQDFFGVWHLEGAGGNNPDGFMDATAQGNHGTGASMPPNDGSEGVVGRGQGFDGGYVSGNFSHPPGGDGDFGAAFWMKTKLDTGRMWVMNVGADTASNGFHFLVRPDSLSQFGIWATGIVQAQERQNIFSLSPFLKDWVHVATVYDSASRILTTYINGTQMDKDTISFFHIDYAKGFSFGKRFPDWVDISGQVQSDLQGALDEVRFFARAPTAAWIKLSYENQKASSRMERLEPER